MGGGGLLGGLFGGSGGSTTKSGYTNMDIDTESTKDNFSTE